MKARIKGTTNIIEVTQIKGIYNNDNVLYQDSSGKTYTWDQLEITNIIIPSFSTPDWFKIYTEITMISFKEFIKLNKSEEYIAQMSIKQADSLIKLLREKYETA